MSHRLMPLFWRLAPYGLSVGLMVRYGSIVHRMLPQITDAEERSEPPAICNDPGECPELRDAA
jgi:hypothetical protein